VDSATTYTVSAITDDALMVSPLTWTWYVDGVGVGTTSDDEISLQAGEPGTTQEVSVYATDAYGRTAFGRTFVATRTNCVDIYGNPGQCQ
jgi:hypothetical protein